MWEVRGAGNDANAGGFIAGASGTDYSQQDSPQVSYTDLVIGATNTQLTSAASPFTAAHVGNLVNVLTWATAGGGVNFANLATVTIASTTLKVTLTNNANGAVQADAVRIYPTATYLPLVADDSQGAPGYVETGTWSGFAGGYNTSQRFTASGGGSATATATWTFTGLAPGQYLVQATWNSDPGHATNAPYAIYDNATLLTTVPANQLNNPVVTTPAFTAGRYQVASVAGAVATMDRAVGTASSTGGAGRLGGALASPGVAAASKVAGNAVWIGPGTYTCSAIANVAGGRVDETTGAAAGSVSRWIGYNAARGDGGTPPVLQAGAAAMSIFTLDAPDVSVENLALANPSAFAGVVGLNVAAAGARASAAKVTAAGMTGQGFLLNGAATIVDGLADGPAIGYEANAPATLVRCGAANGANTAGFGTTAFTASTITLVDCWAVNRSGAGGAGLSTAGSSNQVYGLTVANFTASGCANAVDLTRCSHARLSNVVAAGNRGFGYVMGNDTQMAACAGGLNASGNVGGTPASNVGFVALTADPFANAAGLDFAANRAAGGGALLRGSGVPATLPGTNTASSPDIGVAQHRDPGPIVAPLQPGTFHFLG